MIRVDASTHRDFHTAVSDVSEAISSAGGWIVSHQFYSDTLAMIAFQIPATAIASFGAALASAHITLHHALPDSAGKTDDIPVQLSITFARSGPDLRRPVPAFG
jgi:hypothetical protein